MTTPERRVEVYEDAGGEWRWRRIARNGETVADSGEGYTRSADAVEAAEREFPDDLVNLADDPEATAESMRDVGPGGTLA
jgi:uncharacterized protein YegP (UPF0339 family)